MLVHIKDKRGLVTIDGEYGNVVMIHGKWRDCETPKHFNVEEYRRFYGVERLPDSLTMEDIGYTREDGVSVPPSDVRRSLEVILHQGNALEQRYFAASMDELDTIHLIPDEAMSRICMVHEAEQLTIWYAPEGYFTINPDLGLQFIHVPDGRWGQILIRKNNSAAYWHFATIPHNMLYEQTARILANQNNILLYFSRPEPIFSLKEFDARLTEMSRTTGTDRRILLQKQQNSIWSSLPLLCSCCGEETDKLHKMPDDGDVCASCLEAHYVKCNDCGKVITRPEAKCDSGDILCPSCLSFGKSMGFR